MKYYVEYITMAFSCMLLNILKFSLDLKYSDERTLDNVLLKFHHNIVMLDDF